MHSRAYRVMVWAGFIGGPSLLAATVHSFVVGEVAFPFGLSDEVRRNTGTLLSSAVCILGWIGVVGIMLSLACAAYCQFYTHELSDTDSDDNSL